MGAPTHTDVREDTGTRVPRGCVGTEGPGPPVTTDSCKTEVGVRDRWTSVLHVTD